ncbi:MAG: OadG family protein [Cytophagales bacterium]|nr:OadG family protein [Cytophagales bacterium]
MDQSSILQEGGAITITGIIVVFTALAVLSLVFKYVIPFLITLPERFKKLRSQEEKEELLSKKDARNVPGEVNAVIAAAIHAYLDELHDEESTVLTIQQQQKSYSPWSSKIYSTHRLR